MKTPATMVGFVFQGQTLFGYLYTVCNNGTCIIVIGPQKRYDIPLSDIVAVG